MKFSILTLAFFITIATCLEFDRPCRTDVSAKENFLKSAYTGVWYEIQRTDDEGADCLIHHYTSSPRANNTYDVVRDGRFNGAPVRETGTAALAFPDETPLLAKFNATIDRITGGSIFYNYQVHATDYTNYAITWSCTDLPNGRSREEGVIFGRSTQFTSTVDNKVTFLVSEIGLNRDDFRLIDHSFETCIV